MSGLLCHVTWNNHSSTFLTFLGNLYLKDSLCDATVACLGKYYPVHRLVLSSCSEYFEEIFGQVKCKHPFIILKGINPLEFEALLNYMYKGEVNVPEDKLSDLMKAAEELRIKGLSAPDYAPDDVPVLNKNEKRGVPLFSAPPPKKRKDNWGLNATQSEEDQNNIENTIDQRIRNCQDINIFDENNDYEKEAMPNEKEEQLTQTNEVNTLKNITTTSNNDVSDNQNSKKNSQESSSKTSPKTKENVPTLILDKRPDIASPLHSSEFSQPPTLTVTTTTNNIRPNSADSSLNTNLTEVSKDIDKTRPPKSKLSNKTNSSPIKTSPTSSATISKKFIKHSVHIAGKAFPSINPMVKLSVNEYLKAVEELKRVKIQNQENSSFSSGTESTKNDSVVQLSDSDTSVMSPSRCYREGKEKQSKTDRSLNLELQFCSARRGSQLSSQSNYEKAGSKCVMGSSQRVVTSERKNGTKGKNKMLQLYNLNHIPLNNIFTYRVFRNLNLFIECLMKDLKKEDAFARSLISVFKSLMNYNIISTTIATTLMEHSRDGQGRWIKRIAGLDPPVFGRHVHLDARTGEVLFSNDVIPALMVIWQFRVLINKHGLIKDLKPGFTSSPRHKFLLGIKQKSSFFQKEQLCIFKNNLRNFYRYSLKEDGKWGQ